MKKQFAQITILFFPIFYIFWGTFVNHIAGPFYLTRIDPDYQYLLNGLNCAILEFDRINHVDHPGTPFQVISGIFIWIIHLFSGSESIVEDVYRNPEKYLSISTFFLTVITAWVLLWLGKTVLRLTQDLFGALVLQSSLFFSVFLSDIPFRYIPDRLLMILMLIFIGLCLKYFYGTFKEKKFTIWSGIIMGMGFVTKFVFLPFLVLPFIVIKKVKNKIIYIITLIFSSIVFFLPVYDKYEKFRTFIAGVISHDGLYGGGKSQVFNPDIFTANLSRMMQDNMVFFVLFFISIVVVMIFIVKPALRKKNINTFLFLVAIIIASIVSFIMVAKHYKSYYLVTLLSAGGFIFFLFWRLAKDFAWSKYLKYLFYGALVYILYLPMPWLSLVLKNRAKHVKEYQQTAQTFNKIISSKDYTFMEANWQSGPFVTNGMIWALSYIDHKEYFYNQYEKIYPNHLTWEGQNNPIKYARMIDADNEAILKSGNSIFIYSSPGRYSSSLIDYLRIQESLFNVPLLIDTVYSDLEKEQYLIRARNTTWTTKNEITAGFEKIINGNIYSETGKNKFTGEFNLDKEKSCNGFNSIKLGKEYPQSPKLVLQNVQEGDYIELTIRRRKNDQENKGFLVIGFENEDQTPIYHSNGETLSSVSSNWEILRLSTTIETQPEYNSIACYYQYDGTSEVYIDDFTIKHFSSK